MQNTNETIIAKNICKSFGETIALKECQFIARSGCVNAVVGENGSGKSTLVKILSGVIPPDSGEISILGNNPTSPLEAKRIGLSTIFQEILLANNLSVIENIFMGHENIFKKLNKDYKKKKSEEILKRLTGIDFDVEKDAGSLPLDKKQWIVIARALLIEPKILIFDESSAALDLEATKKLHFEMKRLCSEGTTIIIISHRIKELVNIADYATILRDGNTIAELKGKEITEENLIHHLTSGRIKKNYNPQLDENNSSFETNELILECSNLKLIKNSNSFNIKINKGKILGITGLDGQGQADFIKILSGIKTPFSGKVISFNNHGQKKT